LLDGQKKAESELEYGRLELQVRRSARLQELYDREYKEWEERLRSMGLSIYKNKI
jgi:hypothetical protein